MKTLLTLALTFSFIATASAASKAQLAADNARECHTAIGNEANNKLFSLYDRSLEASQSKKELKSEIISLQENLESFVAVETGCNEETEIGSNERSNCYASIYTAESKRLIAKYKLGKVASTISACKAL